MQPSVSGHALTSVAGGARRPTRQANLDALNRAAYALLERGHVPLIGVNMALPIVRAVGEAHYEAIMQPLSLALVDRCDAALRVGGPSRGADEEVERFVAQGKPVYRSLEEVPPGRLST